MTESIDQSVAAIAKSISDFAKHDKLKASHDMLCAKDGGKFKSTLLELARSNPSATKKYLDNADGINVDIQNGKIVGYQAFGFFGYVGDPGLTNYIAIRSSERVEKCQGLFR